PHRCSRCSRYRCGCRWPARRDRSARRRTIQTAFTTLLGGCVLQPSVTQVAKKIGVPAKAGTHSSTVRAVGPWVPAFAGTPTANHTTPGMTRGGISASLLRVGVGVDRLASGVFVRPEDRLLGVGPPLLQIAALDVMVLDRQDARLRPFAIGAVFDVADYRRDRVCVQPVGELVLVEALGRFDRRS